MEGSDFPVVPLHFTDTLHTHSHVVLHTPTQTHNKPRYTQMLTLEPWSDRLTNPLLKQTHPYVFTYTHIHTYKHIHTHNQLTKEDHLDVSCCTKMSEMNLIGQNIQTEM